MLCGIGWYGTKFRLCSEVTWALYVQDALEYDLSAYGRVAPNFPWHLGLAHDTRMADCLGENTPGVATGELQAV